MLTLPPIQIASPGIADSLILMVMALVVFGPRRLPEIGRQVGKLMYEFRKASNEFKFQMEEELRNAEEADRRKQADQLALAAEATAAAEPGVAAALPAEAAPAVDCYSDPYADSYRGPANSPAAVTLDDPPALSVQPPSTGVPVPALSAAQIASQIASQVDEQSAADSGTDQTIPGAAEFAHDQQGIAEQLHHG